MRYIYLITPIKSVPVDYMKLLTGLYSKEFISFVHFVVIFLIVAARHVIHPCLIVKIPAHGLFDTLLKLQARFPAKLALQLA